MKRIISLMMTSLKPRHFLIFLVLLQLVAWTLVPYFLRNTLHYDVLEGIAWGFEWQLGYYKHPPLCAWLLAGVVKLAHILHLDMELAVYAFSQCMVLSALYPIYQLARAMLPEKPAVIATTLLTGVFYFNTRSINLIPDTLQTPIWAWSIWIFYNALHKNRWRDWLGLAVINALALWAKYSGVFLIFSQGLVLMAIPAYRHYWYARKNNKMLWAILLGIVLILPHIFWLTNQPLTQQGPLAYLQPSLVGPTTWIAHLIHPINYMVSQLPFFIVPILMIGFLFFIDKPIRPITDLDHNIAPDDRRYITILFMTPFALSVLQALITGHKVIGRWSTPYYTCFGIFLVFCFYEKIIKITDTQWRIYQKICLGVFCTILGGRFGMYYTDNYKNVAQSEIYLPTKAVTQLIETHWQARTAQPLRTIIGDAYWATFVSAYAQSTRPNHPHIFLEADLKISPWIQLNKIEKEGAMIIWLAQAGEQALPPVYANLKGAQFIGITPVPKLLRGKPVGAPPVSIGIGYIPPKV